MTEVGYLYIPRIAGMKEDRSNIEYWYLKYARNLALFKTMSVLAVF